MSCRDIHATTAFSLVIALLSVGGLLVATLIPQWRTTQLITHNANARNATVYDGLWTKCVQRDGFSSCYYFDAGWWVKVDQLDLRLLQFCLPAGLAFSTLALFLILMGMCKTACCTPPEPEDPRKNRCLVNSMGCHLVAGMFLFLGGGVALPPAVWFLFSTEELNRRYENIFAVDFAVYVAIGSAGGLLLSALLMFMWYCMCKKLPSPFWLPFPEPPVMPTSMSAQPLVSANGLAPGTYVPQHYPASVVDAQPYAAGAMPGYAANIMAAPLVAPAHMYVPAQMPSVVDGYAASEAGVSQAYGYAPSQGYAQSYAPSQVYAPSQGYGGSQRYASHRYSTRSRLSGIEIDIPVLTEGH